MRRLLAAAVGVLLAGVALVALSVADGSASLALVLIFPVVTGSSPVFFAGVVLIVVGFLAIPFALASSGSPERPESSGPSAREPAASPAPGSGFGGLVLVGPVPIVFGSWKGVSRQTVVWLALAGAVLLIVALVVFVWVVR